ncbi:MAG: hypothetical protein MMC33_003874 [Icmadophila ericetorum]|nr:hypothetical protein [Icmadophila ericetorum]
MKTHQIRCYDVRSLIPLETQNCHMRTPFGRDGAGFSQSTDEDFPQRASTLIEICGPVYHGEPFPGAKFYRGDLRLQQSPLGYNDLRGDLSLTHTVKPGFPYINSTIYDDGLRSPKAEILPRSGTRGMILLFNSCRRDFTTASQTPDEPLATKFARINMDSRTQASVIQVAATPSESGRRVFSEQMVTDLFPCLSDSALKAFTAGSARIP